eukprot:scaffold388_cov244-Pinguiococcus_pyrenoidosus.AAC.19
MLVWQPGVPETCPFPKARDLGCVTVAQTPATPLRRRGHSTSGSCVEDRKGPLRSAWLCSGRHFAPAAERAMQAALHFGRKRAVLRGPAADGAWTPGRRFSEETQENREPARRRRKQPSVFRPSQASQESRSALRSWLAPPRRFGAPGLLGARATPPSASPARREASHCQVPARRTTLPVVVHSRRPAAPWPS